MNKWEMYDRMIDGIPDEVEVIDYGLGINWSWLQAECGSGISYTTRGGSTRPGRRDLRGKPLKKAAGLVKSWCFEEATIGVAALNAWYSQKERIIELVGEENVHFEQGRANRDDVDPFEVIRKKIEASGKRPSLVVVGHFPHVEDIASYADLTVLERNCKNDYDTPDPACEYIIPGSDFVYLTGVTITNKTAPRLLELAEDSMTIMVGPSVVPSEVLFAHGANVLGGRVVVDPEKARFSCASREAFGDSLCPFIASKDYARIS